MKEKWVQEEERWRPLVVRGRNAGPDSWQIVNLYIIIPCLLVLLFYYHYYLCFCPVTVILFHRRSFCHENNFLVCINIPDNKAHSDSDMICSLMSATMQSLINIILLLMSHHYYILIKDYEQRYSDFWNKIYWLCTTRSATCTDKISFDWFWI